MKENEEKENPHPSRMRGRGVEVSKTLFYIAYTIDICYYLYNIKFGQRSVEQFDCPMCIDAYLNFKVFSPMNFNLMNNKIQTKVEIKGQIVRIRLWSVYTLFEFC